jgi:hypothetical protein
MIRLKACDRVIMMIKEPRVESGEWQRAREDRRYL